MSKSITIQEYLVYFSFFFSIFATVGLPFSGFIYSIIFYIQIIFFLIFLIILWDFNRILNYRLGKISVDKFILLLIFIVMVLGAFLVNRQSNSDFKSILKCIAYFPVFLLFAIYLPKIFFNNLLKFEYFLNFIISLGLINAVYGWFAMLTGLQRTSIYSNFLIGIFNHPNASGFAFSLTIPILIYKFFFRNMNKNLFFVVIFLFFVSLLFTFSRAAYIATGIAVLILSYYKSKKIFLITVGLIIILVFSIVIDFMVVKGGVNSFSRVLLYITAFDMITADTFHFLWGYGVINFYDTFSTDKLFLGSVEVVADPHNIILLLGIQFGMIITLLVSIYFLITLFKVPKNIRKYPVGNHYRNLFILCFSVITSLLVQNMFEDIIIYPEFFYMSLFFVYYGFLVKSFRNKKFSNLNLNLS